MKRRWWGDFGTWKLVKELFCRSNTLSLVLFSSSQEGKFPEMLLSERSTWRNSFWCRRNWGTLSKLQDRSAITSNWNFGFQELSLSDTNWSELDFEQSFNTLSFERLVREPSEKKPSKSLSNNDKYSRDLRLPREGGNFPVNWLDERSRTLSSVKLVKHKGNWPTSLLWLRSSSCIFLSLQIPMVIKCRRFGHLMWIQWQFHIK